MSNEKIFISYRRSPGQSDESDARWLSDRLASEFGKDAVFRDVDDASKLLARPFMDVLKEQLDDCTVCIVVIGPRWVADIDRLHDAADPVRFEVGAALARDDVKVLPIIVGEVEFPMPEQLPEDLRKLVSHGGLAITNTNAESQFAKLVDWLKPPTVLEQVKTADERDRKRTDAGKAATIAIDGKWMRIGVVAAVISAIAAVLELLGFGPSTWISSGNEPVDVRSMPLSEFLKGKGKE